MNQLDDPPEPTDPTGAAALTITGLLRDRAGRSPDATARWSLDGNGHWQSSDWRSHLEAAAAIAQGLRGLGLSAGAHVGLMAVSSAAWDDCSMGVLGARGVVVGIDAHATADQAQAQAKLAGLQALVVDEPEQLLRFGPARPALCVVVHPHPGAMLPPGCVTLHALTESGRGLGLVGWDHALPGDRAIVVFTSGTTGAAKGIAYRHEQVCLAVHTILEAFGDIREGSRLACWLPLSNLFQRMINLCAIARAAQTFYVSDPRTVMQHLPAIRPAVFIGVPRFFEKFLQGVQAQARPGGGWRAKLVAWALNVGLAHVAKPGGDLTPAQPVHWRLWLADRLVLRRIRAAMGGQLRYVISGSAALAPVLRTQMAAIGLPIYEAYGLSECIVPIALNRDGAHRPGTVGRPLRGVQTRLAADGELLIRSAGVFDGYLGADGDTAALRAEDWLATGDLAEIDSDGFVRLVGRKSELFKLSTGRRVAPAQIEALLSGVPGVEHLAVFGPGRKAPTLVVSLACGASADAALQALMSRAAQALCALPSYQHPTGAVLTHRPFDIASGELTANLKLRRTQVGQRYAAALEALDAQLDSGAPAGALKPWTMDDETVALVRL